MQIFSWFQCEEHWSDTRYLLVNAAVMLIINKYHSHMAAHSRAEAYKKKKEDFHT